MVKELATLWVELKDGRVIVCHHNGYKIRTLENDKALKKVDEKIKNNFGSLYWLRRALKDNNINKEEILMSTWF